MGLEIGGDFPAIIALRTDRWREQGGFDQRLGRGKGKKIDEMHAARLVHTEVHQDGGVRIKNRTPASHLEAKEMLQHYAVRHWWRAAVEDKIGHYRGFVSIQDCNAGTAGRGTAMRRPVQPVKRGVGPFL